MFALACSEPTAPAPTVTPTSTDTATPVPTSTPRPTPTVTPEPRRLEARPFPPELRQQANAVLERIAQLRGSPSKGEIDMYLLSRAQARAFYAGDPIITGSAGESRPDLRQELYRLLGLVPERSDVQRQALDFLISQITGFYDERLHAFYLLDDLGGVDSAQSRQTVVHELVHALQDQYYDFPALLAQRADDWDAHRALSTLMEGDAIATEIAYFGFSTHRAPLCFAIPPPSRTDIAFVVERDLNSWYEDGLCFVQTVVPRLSNGVAGIWEDPPTTTEQVLHPEKYLTGESARPVALMALETVLGDGWSLVGRHNFGEFSLQNLLLAGLVSDRALVQRAAAGWGGDAWALYAHDDARLLHAAIVWDTADEAQEFWNAFVLSITNRAGGPVTRGSDTTLAADIGGRRWRAAMAGDRVTFLVSTDAEAVGRTASALGMP